MAWAAIASPRPTSASTPSLVLAFKLISPVVRPKRFGQRVPHRREVGVEFGPFANRQSRQIFTDPESAIRQQAAKYAREKPHSTPPSISDRCRGNACRYPPGLAAPSSASQIAWQSTSPSECACEPSLERNFDAANHELAPFHQAVQIVSNSRRIHPSGLWRAPPCGWRGLLHSFSTSSRKSKIT